MRTVSEIVYDDQVIVDNKGNSKRVFDAYPTTPSEKQYRIDFFDGSYVTLNATDRVFLAN